MTMTKSGQPRIVSTHQSPRRAETHRAGRGGEGSYLYDVRQDVKQVGQPGEAVVRDPTLTAEVVVVGRDEPDERTQQQDVQRGQRPGAIELIEANDWF